MEVVVAREKWPTMRTITIRPRGELAMEIDATVTVDGRAIVAIHYPESISDDTGYFPDDAERVGRALLKAAAVCRAKKEAARKPRRTPRKGGR
jgi:hypothetical protein